MYWAHRAVIFAIAQLSYWISYTHPLLILILFFVVVLLVVGISFFEVRQPMNKMNDNKMTTNS